MADDPDLVKKAEEGIDFVKELTGSPKKKPTPGSDFDASDTGDEHGGNVDDDLVQAKKREKELEGRLHDPTSPGGISLGASSALTDTREQIENLEKRKLASGCSGPTIGATIMAILVAILAGVVAVNLLGDDDETASNDCNALGSGLGEVAAAPAQECPDPGASDGSVDTVAPNATVPAGQSARYAGDSGGQIGCIACDGQSRFISIANSTTALGDANRAAQEMVWQQDGSVTDFGISIDGTNRGRYGINLFVNGEYSAGCPLETGQTSCQVADQAPSVLKQGDRVTIIVGEQGTVDEDGVPIEEGEFVMDWYFVFEAA